MSPAINPLVALGVGVATALTDAAYVFFSAAVVARHPARAASCGSLWYLLSAFAVINYTQNALYVAFAMLGSWAGCYTSVLWLRRPRTEPRQTAAGRERP
jgi:hypothetical protein